MIYQYVSDDVLNILQYITHLLIMKTFEVDTIIMSVIQMRKPEAQRYKIICSSSHVY